MTKHLFKVCRPRRNSTPVSKSDRRKDIQTPYFRTYSRRALTDLPKLCTVIEDVETIKKVGIIFRSNA